MLNANFFHCYLNYLRKKVNKSLKSVLHEDVTIDLITNDITKKIVLTAQSTKSELFTFSD